MEQKESLLPEGKNLEVVALFIKERGVRSRDLASGNLLTLRPERSYGDEVPGQIFTIEVKRSWMYNRTHHVNCKILKRTIDIPKVGLTPLKLNDHGIWDPKDEYWGEPGDEIDPIFKPMIKRGKRRCFEMEVVLPGWDPDDIDSDPILLASEYMGMGDDENAYRTLEKVLVEDLRCLDAHSHLGNWMFNRSHSKLAAESALRHYEVGVRIGEQALEKNHLEFEDALPWGFIDNRPFLRCLHGYGLCLWRLGDFNSAEKTFHRMLWMNPSDNQGIRFLFPQVRDKVAWEPED